MNNQVFTRRQKRLTRQKSIIFKSTVIILMIAFVITIALITSPRNKQNSASSRHDNRIVTTQKGSQPTVINRSNSTVSGTSTTLANTLEDGLNAPNYVRGSVQSLVGFHSQDLGFPVQSDATSAIVSMSSSTSGNGYVTLRQNGQVETYNFSFYGSTPNLPMGDTATGIAIDSGGNGYWVITSFGTVYNFGAAPNCGSVNIPQGGWGQYPAAIGIYLSKPTAASPEGYYVLRANGEVDGFCGAIVQSSLQLPYYTTAPIIATSMTIDQKTGGYWILTSEGQVYSYNAPIFESSTPPYDGNSTIGIASLPSATGYVILSANGKIQAFGSSANYGSESNAMPTGAMATSIAIDAATGGYWAVFDWSPRSNYLNPLRSITSLIPQEIDQGVDYCGSGPVFALGSGIVLNIYSNGWPSNIFIAYKLTSGIAAGYIVYVAENVTPDVTVGQQVTYNTVIGTLHDSLTCMETGWANPNNPNGFAMAKAEYTGTNSTAYGINFSQMMEDLGSRPGLVQPNGQPGAILPNWPSV